MPCTKRKKISQAMVGGALSAPVRWTGNAVDYVKGYFFAVSENRRLRQQVVELSAWRDDEAAAAHLQLIPRAAVAYDYRVRIAPDGTRARDHRDHRTDFGDLADLYALGIVVTTADAVNGIEGAARSPRKVRCTTGKGKT